MNVKDAMAILKHVANWNTVISETQYYYELLPRITGISDTELESYTENFWKIKSAVLYRDGEEITVSKDDPKLIRLLNLLANDVKHLGGLAEFVPLYENYELIVLRPYRLEVLYESPSSQLGEYSLLVVSNNGACVVKPDREISGENGEKYFDHNVLAPHNGMFFEDNYGYNCNLLNYVGF